MKHYPPIYILLVLLGFSVALMTHMSHGIHTDIDQQKNQLKDQEQESSEIRKKTIPSEHTGQEMTGVWISYLELQEFSEKYEINEHNYRKFIVGIYDNCVQYGINHVFVHVRPFADALYPSKLYPWSGILTGTQGQHPGFDPLKIMVEEAHARNLYFHAWINPYRITNNDDLSQLSPKSTIYMWIKSENNRNVLLYNGKYYLNPAKNAVRNYIKNGILEIIQNYPVDGIHFDDYFYPSFTEKNYKSAFDAPEYSYYKRNSIKQKKLPVNIADWRRNNVSRLIKDIYQEIQRQNRKSRTKIQFGISPVGNLDCLRSNYQYYVDIDTFMNSAQYIDYVCPQIYWGFHNPEAPFREILNQWCKLSRDPQVQLFIGLPVYKIGMTEKNPDTEEFQDTAIINKMVKYCKKKKTDGIIYYRYNDLSKLKLSTLTN